MSNRKRPYFIESTQDEGATWLRSVDEEFADVMQAQQTLRKLVAGHYRIVAVAWAGRLDVEQVVKSKLVEM
jgi:hypothetical protein